MIHIAECAQIQIGPTVVGIGQIQVVKGVFVGFLKHPFKNRCALLAKIIPVNLAEEEQIRNALQQKKL